MPADSPLASRVRARLAELDSAHLRRTLRSPSGIDLSSNDYLGLANDPRIRAAFIAGIEQEGCGSTGSRLLRGEREAFRAIEARFAAFKQAERALYFSSGYLANLAVIATCAEAGDVVFSDERNHASLIDAMRLSRAQTVVFPHNDADALTRLLEDTPCGGARLIVVESVYSMDGDMAPLARYAALCRACGATLVVDEAHAVGIYGSRGSGLVEATGVDTTACITVNTAGKALGVAGAFVAGPAWVVDYLVQRARTFVFSTAAPPAVANALQASVDAIADEPERRRRLLTLAARMRGALSGQGIEMSASGSHIIPIVLGDNDRAVRAAARLQAAGFDVRAIRPPSVGPGTARLRVSVNTTLSEEDVDRFAVAAAIACREHDRDPFRVAERTC